MLCATSTIYEIHINAELRHIETHKIFISGFKPAKNSEVQNELEIFQFLQLDLRIYYTHKKLRKNLPNIRLLELISTHQPIRTAF